MKITQLDLDQLKVFPRRIKDAKQKVQFLRDQIGLHSMNFSGMPKGSGPRDKIGELMPEIIDAEKELQQLEGTYTETFDRVADWINDLDDIKASLILSLRYLENWDWERIADECASAEGEPITGDSVRKYAVRYLKKMKDNSFGS